MEQLQTLVKYIADVLVDPSPEISLTAQKIIDAVKADKGYRNDAELQTITVQGLTSELFYEEAHCIKQVMADAMQQVADRASNELCAKVDAD